MTPSRWALVAMGMALASCSGGNGREPLGAAEPAASPPADRTPVGDVVVAGPQPEGVVADPASGLVIAAIREPDRLVLIDGATGEQRGVVALPGHARHLQLAAPGGPVLVAAEDSDTFLEVSLPDGEVTVRAAVGTYPHDATAVGGSVVVADERGGTLSVVEDGDVQHSFDDVRQPGGVAGLSDGERVGVIDVGDFTLSLYDVAGRRRLARVVAGEGPTHVVADGRDRLLVADTRGGAVLVYETDPSLRLVEEIPVPGRPYGLAYDTERDRLWVTVTERNEVVAFDVTGDAVEVARLATVRQPNTVAVDPSTGRVAVASRTEGVIQLLDPAMGS